VFFVVLLRVRLPHLGKWVQSTVGAVFQSA
jgi:hypothetical protein